MLRQRNIGGRERTEKEDQGKRRKESLTYFLCPFIQREGR